MYDSMSGTRGLNFGLGLPQLPYIMYARCQIVCSKIMCAGLYDEIFSIKF